MIDLHLVGSDVQQRMVQRFPCRVAVLVYSGRDRELVALLILEVKVERRQEVRGDEVLLEFGEPLAGCSRELV
jgi:hypothetical protein